MAFAVHRNQNPAANDKSCGNDDDSGYVASLSAGSTSTTMVMLSSLSLSNANSSSVNTWYMRGDQRPCLSHTANLGAPPPGSIGDLPNFRCSTPYLNPGTGVHGLTTASASLMNTAIVMPYVAAPAAPVLSTSPRCRKRKHSAIFSENLSPIGSHSSNSDTDASNGGTRRVRKRVRRTPATRMECAPHLKLNANDLKLLQDSSSDESQCGEGGVTSFVHSDDPPSSGTDTHPSRCTTLAVGYRHGDKLGTPEKNRLLYPEIRYRGIPTQYKVRTPPKLRRAAGMRKLRTTDRKHTPYRGAGCRRPVNRVDFIHRFINAHSCVQLVERIFALVTPRDLTALCCVSHTTRNLIRGNAILNGIRLRYLLEKRNTKENSGSALEMPTETPALGGNSDSFPLASGGVDLRYGSASSYSSGLGTSISVVNRSASSVERVEIFAIRNAGPAAQQRRSFSNNVEPIMAADPEYRNWLRFVEASKTSRNLTRCSRCSNPAMLYDNIARCTRHGCQFTVCVKCFNPFCESIRYFSSKDGEADAENQSPLMVTAPPCSFHEPDNKMDLSYSSSSPDCSDCDNKLVDKSNLMDATAQRETMRSTARRLLFTSKETLRRHRKLARGVSFPTSDTLAVTTNRTWSTSVDVTGSQDSPPRVKSTYSIGSKQSKKNLRRL